MATVDGFAASRPKHALLATLTSRPTAPVKDLPAQSQYLVEPMVATLDLGATLEPRLKRVSQYFGSLRTPARCSLGWCVNVAKRYVSVVEDHDDLNQSAALMRLVAHGLTGSDHRKPFGPGCFAWYVAALAAVAAIEQFLLRIVSGDSDADMRTETATGFGLANEVFDLLQRKVASEGSDKEAIAAAQLLNDCLGDAKGHFLRNHLWHGFIQPNNSTTPVFQLCVALLEMSVCVFAHRLDSDSSDRASKAKSVTPNARLSLDDDFSRRVLQVLDEDAALVEALKTSATDGAEATERDSCEHAQADGQVERQFVPQQWPPSALRPVQTTDAAASTIVSWANTIEWIVANGLHDATALTEGDGDGLNAPTRLLQLPLCVAIEAALRSVVASTVCSPADQQRVVMAHVGQQFYTLTQLLLAPLVPWTDLIMDPSTVPADASPDAFTTDADATAALGPTLRAWSAFFLRQPPVGLSIRNRLAHCRESILDVPASCIQVLCRLAAGTLPGCGRLCTKAPPSLLRLTVDRIASVELFFDVAYRSAVENAQALFAAASPSEAGDDAVDAVLSAQGIVPRDSVKDADDAPTPLDLAAVTMALQTKRNLILGDVPAEAMTALLERDEAVPPAAIVASARAEQGTAPDAATAALELTSAWLTPAALADVKARIGVINALSNALSKYTADITAIQKLIADRKARTAHRKKLALLMAGRGATAVLALQRCQQLKAGARGKASSKALANLAQKLEAVVGDTAAVTTIASLVATG